MNTASPDEPESLQFNRGQFMFLRTMGHELRSPLNSILATCEMMVNAVYGELQPSQAKAAQRILRNSNRLLNLISAVMTFIRAQANALELNSLPVPLVELLKEQFSRSQERATTKGLSMEMIVQEGTIETVHGDPEQIAFIVNELLGNAITFTPSGSIQMQVGNADPGRWALTVTDTGVGIEQENLACVFDPFWRGKDAKQHTQEGNGLGLTIVHEFIRMMHGVIHVESQVGKGTTVKITLPNTIPPIHIS